MDTYIITNTDKPNWANFKNFETLTLANEYASSLGPKYHASLSEKEIKELSDAEKASADIAFGKMLSFDFLTNEIGKARTPEEVDLLSSKFMEVDFLLQKGAIKAARVKILAIATDELFTITDKNRYINMIDEYLSVQYA